MTEIMLGILWIVFLFSFLILLSEKKTIEERLDKLDKIGYHLDGLKRKIDVVGRYYKFVNGKVKWSEFRKEDVLDEVDGYIKIKCGWSSIYDIWISQKDVLYYDRIDKKKEAEIIKRLQKTKIPQEEWSVTKSDKKDT